MANTVKFQHFEVLQKEDGSLFELGRGAMGITYKAFDTNLRCHVALKVIKSAYLNSETAQQRFLREARAAAAIRHPNVASVFHLGREADNYFYAMEFVDGETVEAFIKREGAVPPIMALKIAAQVARALAAAQKQGLVHRDIKPSNIMFMREDGGDIAVKVIDFGLAKNAGADAEDSTTLTTGGFLGTPHFASPEQLEEREIDVRSDIYSLGVTLWYMLAGKTLFTGSTAQVMSQHLHREPPFEALRGQPAPVFRLLRRMIAKNPADRPQTAFELRREIEDCIEELEENASAEGTDLLERLPAPAKALESGDVAEGALLAERYLLSKEISASDHGRMFRAERITDKSVVAVLILPPSLTSQSEEFTRLEHEVESLKELRSPTLQRILSLECTDTQSFLVLEWIEGPALLDLLRSRRALPANEAKLLLLPLADAFDELAFAGLGCPDIAAHEIVLPGADVGQPVSSWPVCQPKFLPLATSGSAAASPEATLVASSFALMKEKGVFARTPSTAYVYAVASLAYEMLGGVRAATSMDTYVPIPELSEQGNSILRRALTPGQVYKSARAFVEDLPEETSFAARSPSIPVAELTPSPLPQEKPRPSSLKWLIATGVLLLIGSVVIWQGTRWFDRLRQASRIGLISPTPEPAPTAPPASTAPPAPTVPPSSTAPPESAPASTPASTPPLAIPERVPSPYERALAGAEELQRKDELAAALAAYAEVAAQFPDERQPREAMEMISASLRERASRMRPAEVDALRQPLEKAAALEVVSAQMLLGEMLRQSEPEDALRWFMAAGHLGQTEAMVFAGQMMASGRGVEAPDLQAAADWFSRAAERGDSGGMYALAECHLFGKGVAKDPRRAIELLTAASALNHPRAMNLLGDLYRKGVPGVLEPDFQKSARLFSQAKDLGFLDAQGNLGVLYIYGQGVPKDEAKAFALFREGAEKGNPLCMYFYAMCFDGGVAVNQDRESARRWYVRAAQGGNRTAIEWCKKNNIPLASPP